MIPVDCALHDPKRATRFAFWRLRGALSTERHGLGDPAAAVALDNHSRKLA